MKRLALVCLLCTAVMVGTALLSTAVEAQPIPPTSQCSTCASQSLVFNGVPSFKKGFIADGGQFTNTIKSTMNDGGVTLQTTQGTQPLSLKSGVVDSATAVGSVFDTTNTLSTTGSKLASFRNGGSELDFVDKAGGYNFPVNVGPTWNAGNTSIYYDGANHLVMSVGNSVQANQWSNANAGAPNTLGSNRVDSASSIGTVINTNATYSTAGDKLLSVQNNTTVKWELTGQGKPLTTTGDSSASPGAATLNVVCGRSAIASGASSVVVTNSNVATASNVFPVMETSGVGVGNLTVVPTSGSFTVTSINALGVVTSVTSNLKFSWCVYN